MEERPKKRQKVTYRLIIDDSTCASGKRTLRSKSEHRAVEQGKRVECANALYLRDFELKFFPEGSTTWDTPACRDELFGLTGVFTNPGTDPMLVNQCFRLVEHTSKHDYANSEVKWSPAKKMKEMHLPDMKYLVLQSIPGILVVGFISMMVTYEDGHEVLYVYEIHLASPYQGKGFGRRLMEVAEQIGRNVYLEKVMLTVFRSNTTAVGMYKRLGYSVDKYSPQPKTLRNGAVKESGYVILSKNLKEEKT